MSLLELNRDSSLSAGHAPSGDDYAKGSSYLLWTTLAAAVVVSVGICLFLMANRKPPAAAGEVTQVWAHGVHTVHAAQGASGAPAASFDQVLVFANVRLRNQSDKAIVLQEMMTNVTLEDGVRSSYVATATDYSRIFLAYPQLADLRGKTLARDTVIQPGQALEGTIVSAFHLSKEEWDVRKDLNFTFEFKLHPDLVITPHSAIVEQ